MMKQIVSEKSKKPLSYFKSLDFFIFILMIIMACMMIFQSRSYDINHQLEQKIIELENKKDEQVTAYASPS